MFERYTSQARTTIAHTHEEARLFNHRVVEPYHLFAALAGTCGETGLVGLVFQKYGLTQDEIRRRTENYVGRGKGVPGEISFSSDMARTLDFALRECLRLGAQYIGVEHLLLGLSITGNSLVSEILEEFVGDYDVVRSALGFS